MRRGGGGFLRSWDRAFSLQGAAPPRGRPLTNPRAPAGAPPHQPARARAAPCRREGSAATLIAWLFREAERIPHAYGAGWPGPPARNGRRPRRPRRRPAFRAPGCRGRGGGNAPRDRGRPPRAPAAGRAPGPARDAWARAPEAARRAAAGTAPCGEGGIPGARGPGRRASRSKSARFHKKPRSTQIRAVPPRGVGPTPRRRLCRSGGHV